MEAYTLTTPTTLARAIRILEIVERLESAQPDHTQPSNDEAMQYSLTGQYVIVRGNRSGVFCGNLVSVQAQTVELTDCRHIWYWAGAANTADMALKGVSRPKECKFVAPVNRLRVLDAIEVIDCTKEAEASLQAVPVWTKS